MPLRRSLRRSPPALTDQIVDDLVQFAVWVDDLAVTAAQRGDLARRLATAWRSGDTASIENALETVSLWRQIRRDDPTVRTRCREWMIEQQAILSERAYISWTLEVSMAQRHSSSEDYQALFSASSRAAQARIGAYSRWSAH